MKLLICAMEYPPEGSGIGNVVHNVAIHLKKMGIECRICSPSGPDISLGSKELIQRYGFFGIVFFWYKVSQFLKREDYDCVWVHNPYFIFQFPFSQGISTIHTTYYGVWHNHIGNTGSLHFYNKIASIIERYCLLKTSKVSLFTCVGRPVCHELEMIGIKNDQIRYIPNGVDVNRFKSYENKKEFRKKHGIPEADIVLLSVGRLTPQKRPYILIEVFSLIEKQTSNLTLCFAGKGELLEETKNLVKQRGLKKVIFLEYVEEENLPRLYSSSDYYIMASKYEGAPLTLYEAMASGLPCIVSDITNLDLVTKSNCGIVVNFDNSAVAAKEILTYIDENHSEHAKNARDFAVRES